MSTQGNDRSQARVAEVREWYAANPDRHPPRKTPLGRWVSRQRWRHKTNKLPAGEVAELEAIPGWQWARFPSWDEYLTEVREWYAVKPDQHPSQQTPIGRWVSHQRWRHKTNKLPAGEVAELEAIPGWQWARFPSWDEYLTEVREWYAANPDRHPNKSTSLGHWVHNQRRQNKQGKLPAERVAELEAIDGWEWSARVKGV